MQILWGHCYCLTTPVLKKWQRALLIQFRHRLQIEELCDTKFLRDTSCQVFFITSCKYFHCLRHDSRDLLTAEQEYAAFFAAQSLYSLFNRQARNAL